MFMFRQIKGLAVFQDNLVQSLSNIIPDANPTLYLRDVQILSVPPIGPKFL